MSPRILHYGREQMIWDCRISLSSESRTSEEENWPNGSLGGWNWSRNKHFVLSLEGSRSLDLIYGSDGIPLISAQGQPLRGPRSRNSDHMGPYTNWCHKTLQGLAKEPESIYRKIPANNPGYYLVKRPLYTVSVIRIS